MTEPASELDVMWLLQKDQQQLWHKLDDMTPGEVALLIKDLLLHLHEEVGELQRMMDQSRYHFLKRAPLHDKDGLALAGADVLKLLIALLQIGRVTAADLATAFRVKTAQVEAKWKWEQDQLGGVDVLLCDIDGVIAQWSAAFLVYAKERGVEVEWGKLNAPHLEPTKADFARDGKFLDLATYEGAVDTLNNWRSNKRTQPSRGGSRRLILVTARSKRLYADTTAWLDRVQLYYDHIMFESDKAEAVRLARPGNVLAHIEDRGKHALEVAATGTPVYKLPYEAAEETISHPLITNVRNWADIRALLEC